MSELSWIITNLYLTRTILHHETLFVFQFQSPAGSSGDLRFFGCLGRFFAFSDSCFGFSVGGFSNSTLQCQQSWVVERLEMLVSGRRGGEIRFAQRAPPVDTCGRIWLSRWLRVPWPIVSSDVWHDGFWVDMCVLKRFIDEWRVCWGMWGASPSEIDSVYISSARPLSEWGKRQSHCCKIFSNASLLLLWVKGWDMSSSKTTRTKPTVSNCSRLADAELRHALC